MQLKTILLLILAGVLNAALCAGTFFVQLFATSPEMDDVTMRIGYYVLNAISLLALAGIFAPWILTLGRHTKSATVFALLPLALTCLAIVAFLLFDSWLNRTFVAAG